MTTIFERPTSPNPPRFRKGATVAFRTLPGTVFTGTFVRRFTPARNAGYHYEIRIDGQSVELFANGLAGRSVTVQS